ncbi:MAG: ProQ/FinO family protein [Pseudomonadota bacterium]
MSETTEPKTRRARDARPARQVHPLLHRLWELHPRLFGARFRPLKVGIFEDLIARHPEAFDQQELKQALAQHVRSTRYLEAVASGDARHDLDGQPVEPAAPEHVQHAIMEAMRRRQPRGADEARAWARVRLVQAIEASGLSREDYMARIRTQEPVALALLDEAFAELAEQSARREALLRAFRASGRAVDEFAQMYGLDAEVVRQALAQADAP